MTTQTQTPTVIGHSLLDRVILYGGLPLLGLVLGFFLPRIADWAVEKDLPMPGPVQLVTRWDGWWVIAILTALGLVGGVILASIALADSLKVTVADDAVEFLKNEKTLRVPREQVAVAFLDGKEIVLQDRTSRELAREKHDQIGKEARKIPTAFRDHGYPWTDDGDPHEHRFRRWVEDEPDLSRSVNALLRARARAFDAGDKGKADLRELRDEVAKLDVTVRDRDGKQYWRPTTPA